MSALMTVQKLANYLGVNKRTIYRMLDRGEIPAVKVGRSWRFEQASIDDWLCAHSVGTKASILVIDDDATIRRLLTETLDELGHTVVTAKASSEGLELVKQQDFDLVFLDLKMPGMDGAELFGRMKEVRPALPVIIITGYPDSEIMTRALAQGPFAVMNKPFGESEIILAVKTFLRVKPGN